MLSLGRKVLKPKSQNTPFAIIAVLAISGIASFLLQKALTNGFVRTASVPLQWEQQPAASKHQHQHQQDDDSRGQIAVAAVTVANKTESTAPIAASNDGKITEERPAQITVGKEEHPESSDIRLHGFRKYPPNMYYGLTNETDYLMSSTYIFGKRPILLKTSTPIKKLTFMGKSKNQPDDGTNPSLLSVERILQAEKNFNISKSFLQPAPPQTIWVASSVYKCNNRCPNRKKFSKEVFFVAYLFFLGENFEVLAQTTIQHSMSMDDPRLFLWKGNVYVSHLSTSNMHRSQNGYRISLEKVSSTSSPQKLRAFADIDSRIYFPKGRNMAALENLNHPSVFQIVSWVDPLTVLRWDNSSYLHFNRPWLNDDYKPDFMYSPIVNKPNTSHFHGTNGMMLYLPKENEFLGIAHRHREQKNKTLAKEIYPFGHHYTHAFFTINVKAPYFLKKLSQEFVFQSSRHPQDADLIQFASGLDIDTNTQDIIISYGINDCESAIARISTVTVQEMLKPVEKGKDILEYTWSLPQRTIT